MRRLCGAILLVLVLGACRSAGAEIAAESSISPRFFGSPPPAGLSVETAIAKAVDEADGRNHVVVSADAGPWDQMKGSSLIEYDGWVWVVRLDSEITPMGCPGLLSCAAWVPAPQDVFIDYETGAGVAIRYGSLVEDR